MNKHRSIRWMSLCLWVSLGLGAAAAPAAGTRGPAVTPDPDDPFAALDVMSKTTAAPAAAEVNEAPLYLETVPLRFLDPNSLVAVLQPMHTARGAVAINKATKSVLLCDTRESLDRMVAEIKKADHMPQQVMVEVVLLDVQLKNDTEAGINWDLLSNERYNFGYRQNFTPRLSSTPEVLSDTTDPATNSVGAATAFNTVGAGGDISVIFGTVRNVLHLLQEKRNVNILADPKMLVVSGKSATIDVVEEIPYREITDTGAGGQGALTSTQFKEVGVKLEVSAVVIDENDIYLTVASEQSVRIGDSVGGVPVVDSRRASTALMLGDGETVLMGGMRREEKTRQVSQIPLLGDLPLIGFLFRSTTVGTSRSELVLLLSPRLSRGGLLPAGAAARLEDVHREDWLTHPAGDAEKTGETAAGSKGSPVTK